MDNDEAKGVFETKTIKFLDRTVSILMQSVNGPCALIAICNVLLLRGDIKLSPEMRELTLNGLINLVEMWLSDPNRRTGGFFLNKQRQDILTVLESFANFVNNVDVGFLNIHDFEFTLEMAIFKFLNVELVHGWLLDPLDEATCWAVGDSSYTSLQERLMTSSDRRETSVSETDDESLGKEQGEAKKCMHQFAIGSQLTYHGLFRLHEALQERELYVLFRNNHFSTLVKYKKEIYMLITDISYKDKPNHVWEKLCEVTGNSQFYTAEFAPAGALGG